MSSLQRPHDVRLRGLPASARPRCRRAAGESCNTVSRQLRIASPRVTLSPQAVLGGEGRGEGPAAAAWMHVFSHRTGSADGVSRKDGGTETSLQFPSLRSSVRPFSGIRIQSLYLRIRIRYHTDTGEKTSPRIRPSDARRCLGIFRRDQPLPTSLASPRPWLARPPPSRTPPPSRVRSPSPSTGLRRAESTRSSVRTPRTPSTSQASSVA